MSQPSHSVISNPDPNPKPDPQTQQHDDDLHHVSCTFSFSDWLSDSDLESDSDSDSYTDTCPFGTGIFETIQPDRVDDGSVLCPGSDVEESMNDGDSWGLADNSNFGALSSFMEELVPGFSEESVRDETSARADGLRIAAIDSDSDSEVVDLSPSSVDDYLGSLRFWDNFLEDEMEPETPREQIGWEELDRGINQSRDLEMANDRMEEFSGSSSSISALEEEENGPVDLMQDFEWEVLLAVNNRINEMEDSFMFDADYHAFLEQLFENEINLRGSPPAATRVVENLPLVEVREEEGMAVCAVCKDEVVEGEKVNRLPCCHYYHGDCIMPWLRIRNTCPVCRFELPTDDEDYESSRRRRLGADSGISIESPDGYDFQMFA